MQNCKRNRSIFFQSTIRKEYETLESEENELEDLTRFYYRDLVREGPKSMINVEFGFTLRRFEICINGAGGTRLQIFC